MDYDIWYGSVMMSAHQQCPGNDSTYTETLSVDNEGEYELTGLDPGLQYCVRGWLGGPVLDLGLSHTHSYHVRVATLYFV